MPSPRRTADGSKKLDAAFARIEVASKTTCALEAELEATRGGASRVLRLMRSASEELKRDPEVVKLALAQDGHALMYAADELKRDPEVVMVALEQNGNALEHAAVELQRDPELVELALLQRRAALS